MPSGIRSIRWQNAHFTFTLKTRNEGGAKMANNSAAKIKVDGISQIAIAVNNLEEVAENFWTLRARPI
jgi:hypothetical protein